MQHIILNLYIIGTLSSPCSRTGYPGLIFHEAYIRYYGAFQDFHIGRAISRIVYPFLLNATPVII